MYYKSTEHEKAYNLFFQTDFTRKQIADLLNVDRKTLFTWIREGNWLRARTAARHAPSLLVEQYYNQLCELNLKIAEREEMPYPTKDEAEVIRKLTATISIYSKKRTSIGETMEVLMDFHQYLDRNYAFEGRYVINFTNKYVESLTNLGTSHDYTKLHNANYSRDKEYDRFLEEQAKLRKDDPDNGTDTGSQDPPLSAAEALSAKAAKPPFRTPEGKTIPIPDSRKNFRKENPAEQPGSTTYVTESPCHLEPSKDETQALNADATTYVTVSPVEPQTLNADSITPPSEGMGEVPGAQTGNLTTTENAPKPATEATNEETTSIENGEFQNNKKEVNVIKPSSAARRPAPFIGQSPEDYLKHWRNNPAA